MTTFSEASQWVDVTQYANYDYVVCDITTMNITCATFTPVVGNQIVGTTEGQIGYIFQTNGSGWDVANVTSTVFDAGTDYYIDNGGATYSATVSNVSSTFGPQNKPLSELVDRTKYNKDQYDAHIQTTNSTAHQHTSETISGFVEGSGLSPFRNRIINGDFTVWERQDGSENLRGVGLGDYSTDRWVFTNSLASGTISSKKISLETDLKTGFAASISVVDSGTISVSTQFVNPFTQIIEGYNSYDLVDNDITVSFDFKASTTGSYSIALRNGPFAAADVTSFVTEFDYTSADTVQHVTKTINIPATVSISNSSTQGLTLLVGVISGSTYVTSTLDAWTATGVNVFSSPNQVDWISSAGNYLAMTNVQITKGSYEQPFEVVPYDIQLQRCQRYYEMCDSRVVHVGSNSGTSVYGIWTYKVRKRAIPSDYGVGASSLYDTFTPGIDSVDCSYAHPINALLITPGSWVDSEF